MWWAAENWTEYIHPKPLGYHIQPWPAPKSSYHCTHLFPLTLTNACRDTSNFISKSQLLVHLHAHISPCSRICCNSCSQKWMQSKTFSWGFAHIFTFLQTQKFLCKQRWWARPGELEPFPLSLSCQNCCFFWLPSPREQIQPAGWETCASVSSLSQGRVPC